MIPLAPGCVCGACLLACAAAGGRLRRPSVARQSRGPSYRFPGCSSKAGLWPAALKAAAIKHQHQHRIAGGFKGEAL